MKALNSSSEHHKSQVKIGIAILYTLINVLTNVSTLVMTLLLTPLTIQITNIKNLLKYVISSIDILIVGTYFLNTNTWHGDADVSAEVPRALVVKAEVISEKPRSSPKMSESEDKGQES